MTSALRIGYKGRSRSRRRTVIVGTSATVTMIAWIKLGASARIDGLTTKESTKAVETGRSRIGIARCRSGFSSANLRTPRRIQKSAKAITRIRTAWNRNAEGTRLLNALDAFGCEEND